MRKCAQRSFSHALYLWRNNAMKSSGRPVLVATDGLRVAKVFAAEKHFALITADGQLYTWGANGSGQLGQGDRQSREAPTLVKSLQRHAIVDVAISKHHTLALDDEGRLFSCGRGRYPDVLRRLLLSGCMALGHKEAVDLAHFKPVEALRGARVRQIATGYHNAMALDGDGGVWNWGRNEFGASGMGNTQSAVPVPNIVVNEISRQKGCAVRKIDSCADFSAFLLENGELYSFGNNDQSVMGIGEAPGFEVSESVNYPTPVRGEDKSYPLFADFSLGQATLALVDAAGSVSLCGQKTYHHPAPFPLELKGRRLRCVAAGDRGVGVLTEDNAFLAMDGFWTKTGARVSPLTGLVEVDVAGSFGQAQVLAVGGKYAWRFALVETA